MAKAFFEKLTHAGQAIGTKQSVIKNVENILNFGGFLDAGVDGYGNRAVSTMEGIYRNGLMAVVDQSLDNQQQIDQFQQNMLQVLKVYEPRIKNIWVLNLGAVKQRSRCQLKIELEGEQFEQGFVFG
ncbi:hypothetical protein [Marinomonas transparens]|uniref:Uncharacterized protein n=1 Tax=Marinomonas transparens TaxID=2795388 RepID=A0A934N4E6_9GAMM|nr:hypothetical protein [Marinomonas transparens]MBJ7540008.1 hypothetical protein [Marinomonas transparens]